MKNKPLISVLIPAYNQPKYTRECLESIVSQEGFSSGELEIIMVDDASPDDLTGVGGEYEARYKETHNFRFERNIVNRGMVGNWNYLLGIKRADYFMFISNDDKLIHKNTLRNLYQRIKDTNFNFIFGERLFIDQDGEMLDMISSAKKYYLTRGTEVSQENSYMFPGFGGILYKNKGISFDDKASEYADGLFNLEYAILGKGLYDNHPSFAYRIHTNQAIHKTGPWRHLILSCYILKKSIKKAGLKWAISYSMRVIIGFLFILYIRYVAIY